MMRMTIYDKKGEIMSVLETEDPFRQDGTLRAVFARELLNAAMLDLNVDFEFKEKNRIKLCSSETEKKR